MPEGDSLRRAESLLSPILEGQVVSEIWFRKLKGYRPRAGQTIEEIDIDQVVVRTRELARNRVIAEALLDQRIAAGVGNVFKSEVAFSCWGSSLHPSCVVT